MKIRKQGRQRPTRSERPQKLPITLFLHRVPADTFHTLHPDDRYAVLLLGHIHDEISWLQRTAYSSAGRKHHATDLERSADLMMTTCLARVLLGKLHEFRVVLGKETRLRSFIAKHWLPDDPAAGQQRLQEIESAFDGVTWLPRARNKHFLHYPTFGDVKETIDDQNILWDIQVAHGASSTSTFHPGSDVLANYAWFRLVNSAEPMRGLEDALTALSDLTRLTVNTLEQAVGFFMDGHLVPLSNHEEVVIHAPPIAETRPEYFVFTRKAPAADA